MKVMVCAEFEYSCGFEDANGKHYYPSAIEMELPCLPPLGGSIRLAKEQEQKMINQLKKAYEECGEDWESVKGDWSIEDLDIVEDITYWAREGMFYIFLGL